MEGFAAAISPEAWAGLSRAGHPRFFGAGELMLRQGEFDRHVIVLLHGQVKVTRIEDDGEQMVLALRAAGDLIGEIAYLDGGSHSATVAAVRPCSTRVISAQAFADLLKRYELDDALVRHVLRRFRQGEELRAELAILPADLRVVRALLRMAQTSGTTDIALTQTELGRIVGLSRSAVSAVLAKLRAKGLISTAWRRIAILDLESLQSLRLGTFERPNRDNPSGGPM